MTWTNRLYMGPVRAYKGRRAKTVDIDMSRPRPGGWVLADFGDGRVEQGLLARDFGIKDADVWAEWESRKQP